MTTTDPTTPEAAGTPFVVLGATGAVGHHVAALLATRGHRVVVVSRHADQARTVADALPGATGVAGNIDDPASIAVESPGVVVNCTGTEDVAALTRWRLAGWRVVDITASSPYATDLVELDHDGPPLIVGVGLIPGVTSLLARHLVEADESVRSVTISCLVGLGEEYGDASRAWTYGQLGRTIEDPSGVFRNFSDPAVVDFPGGFGRRRAWRFDFADRAILPPEIGVAVTTRYGFDSRGAGRALALASAIPHAPAMLLRLNRLSRRAVEGTAWWAGVIETDTGARATAIGNGQSRGTAAITAIAADRLSRLDESERHARFLWDLVDIDDIRNEITEEGILIEAN